MSRQTWIVEDMEDEAARDVPFSMRRLEILHNRLARHMSTCQETIGKPSEENNNMESDELAMCKLELVLESFTSELKDQSKEVHSRSERLKLEEFLDLQGEAQELLAAFKVRNRRHYEKTDGTQPTPAITTSRLPKLNLDKFSGDVLKWCSFWDSFSANVDKRKDLADVDKFSYLLGSLEGEAKQAIGGLKVTNLNYKIAVDELLERFGHSDAIIDAHYVALRKLAPAAKNAQDCRRKLTEIEQHLRVLEALGEPVNTNNQLRSTIMEKFPENVLYNLKMTIKAKDSSIPTIRQALKDIISANETGSFSDGQLPTNPENRFTTESLFAGASYPGTNQLKADANNNNNSMSKGNEQNRKLNSIPTLSNKNQGALKRPNSDQIRGPPKKQPTRPCIFCGEGHYNDSCTKVATLAGRLTKLKDRCRICLSKGHWATACRRAPIVCFHCKETSHNRSLCPTYLKTKPQEACTTTLSSSSQWETKAILQTATARVFRDHDSEKRSARLLFDSGSQKTYVTSSLAKQLNLDIIDDLYLSVYTFGHTEPKHIETNLVALKIEIHNGYSIDVMAHVIPSITGTIPTSTVMKQKIAQIHPDKQMAPDSLQDSPADILIGIDHYHSFFTGLTEQITDNLFLVHTKLGWMASGSARHDSSSEVLSVLTYVQRGQGKFSRDLTAPDPPLRDDTIKDLWELECIGIRDSPKQMKDDEIINFFNANIQFIDGRYYVKWPWSQFPSDLPVNYGMAYGRLKGLLQRTNRYTLQKYDEVIQQQLSQGVIEPVTEHKFPTTHPIHYLPHHCVMQENKTTKLRIVYDASAKQKGCCSLNEYLHKGPLLLEDLVSLLMNFRVYSIGLVADIEKAFLQVGLMPEDRDVTRFLWLRDVTQEPSESNLIHLRFCRVPFGVVSSPFLLAATVKHHLLQLNSTITEKISNSLYVDNLVTGVNTPEEALTLFQEGKSAFEGLSMNLREWDSNCHEFLNTIPKEQRTEQTSPISVLGIKWNTQNDTIMLAVDSSTLLRPVSSKREILSIIASIYDPCGWVAPLLLSAKLFLQKLWIEKFKWDTPLPTDKIEEWAHCAYPFKFLPESRFPRHLFGCASTNPTHVSQTSFDLHCFTDASKDAYSTVIYVVSENPQRTTTNLLISRTRLIPIKHKDFMTIPKKELLGVLIGTRLVQYVRDALRIPIRHTFLWTDSSIVLGWLRTEHLLPPFVNKRVAEINACPDIRIRYVQSTNNSADVATRPRSEPLPTLWLKGPEFLLKSQQHWPNETVPNGNIDLALPAHTTGEDSAIECRQPSTTNETAEGPDGRVAPLHTSADGSSEMLRESHGDGNETSPFEQTEEMFEPDNTVGPVSELEVIRNLQLEHFPNEVNGKPSTLSRNLGLFVDRSGLLRCTGRLQNADLPYDQTHPILLPKSTQFTLETIRRIHVKNHHVGASHTLALVRRKYWVPQGRTQVNFVIKRCTQCIKHGGGPYKLPPMPPLPAERVRLCTPFSYVGLDYLGPLTVLDQNLTTKRWVCIFTCMATRAIRLEVVQNMSAEEFLLCLRRFVALQGTPLLIVSDNAAQFKLIADILQSPLCTQNNIAWHFIPELAPWQGGFYERLVALIKHCLRRSVDKTLLTDTQLATILREIETILNTRPLTYVGSDLDFVLTPSDFLSNCGTHRLPGADGPKQTNLTATKVELIDGWKRGMALIQEFSSMFKDQYLANLRERAMVPHKQHRITADKHPKIGDIVQLGDGQSKSTNRTHWKVGKITALLPSSDGYVRTAQVTLENGTILNRSIGHLYPLEFGNTECTSEDTAPPVCDANEGTDSQAVSETPISTPVNQLGDEESAAEEIGTCASQSQTTDSTIQEQYQENEDDPSNSTLDRSTQRPRRRAATLARNIIRRWTEDLANLAT